MAGWAREPGVAGFARETCGRRIQLCRLVDGSPAAILDRCLHRFAPHSLGPPSVAQGVFPPDARVDLWLGMHWNAPASIRLELFRQAFDEEGRPLIEAAHAKVKGRDFCGEKPLSLGSGQGGARARRLLEKLIAGEAQAHG